ncbi:TetR family transcriptional regulator C-terminal domain-containing protein [Diaphorobacter sp. HDW4A]|uniref:TetR family transcriptional regulator C-terminal domain-containing protein n=1 Tax=Diaphorobacter sp. HDW4A TaxID=2714924 RepID=UPI00197EEA92
MTDVRKVSNATAPDEASARSKKVRAHSDDAPAPSNVPPNGTRAPTASRLRKEQNILKEAENQFAVFGFEGASLEGIANAVGISRHNLLYYFPSKEVLYRRVLDDVVFGWLAGMEDVWREPTDPVKALRTYIHGKLRSSLERPNAAKIFAKEVIAGAPRYADVIAARVKPVLDLEVKTFETWAQKGLVTRLDFTHLMFVIWTVTQAYAEHQTQFAILLGKPALDESDYDKAEEVITRLVLSGLGQKVD